MSHHLRAGEQYNFDVDCNSVHSRRILPNSQLFGLTGTPIFAGNSSYKRIEGDVQTVTTTQDLFQKSLHEYTITHAIEDGNVLRFHVDYFKPERTHPLTSCAAPQTLAKKAVVDAILAKHHPATGERKFNALFATASINDAIDYYNLFVTRQNGLMVADPEYVPLNIAAVFSPPAENRARPRRFTIRGSRARSKRNSNNHTWIVARRGRRNPLRQRAQNAYYVRGSFARDSLTRRRPRNLRAESV
jgi:type I site-specific restriction-modification system R (restriction) subunit